MRQKIKVAIITHSISHFEVPFFRALAATSEIEPYVIYWDKIGIEEKYDLLYNRPIKWGLDLLSGYRSQFVKNYYELILALAKNNFDAAIIYGYESWHKILTIVFCRLFGISLIFRGTATLLEKRSRLKSLIKKFVLTLLFKLFKAVLVGGTYNKQYYQYYGFKEEQMFFIPFSIDVSRFLKLAEEIKKQKENIKKSLKISTAIIILFIGNFIPKKGPDIMLKSFNKFIKIFPNAHLIMAGDGILMNSLKKYAAENNIENKISFLGFQNQQEVPQLYAISDFVVFPSLYDETWGRAVNEAMAYSLPIIASRKVGATGDIVKDGINGFVVKENDIDEITEKMFVLANDKKLRKKMGNKSKEIISKWTYENYIQNAIQAIKYSLKKIL
jgi:glycosyltransferase involved in cell wall biosynthesis